MGSAVNDTGRCRDYLRKLNNEQLEAVLDESRTCVVNANVGSGKTTVLIAKILYLYYEKQIDYEDMVVLTFTNKAAEEIKERLREMEGALPPEVLRGFGTFHSVAYYLLKNALPVEEIGYAGDFSVMAPEEELALAETLVREKKLKIKYPARLKNRLEQALALTEGDRESAQAQRLSKYKDDIWELAVLVKEEKRRKNRMTFRELLENAIRLLRSYPVSCRWIVIDEVQDSDELQLEFIDALRNADTRLFAVGDPNQIIYSWRGSSVDACFTLAHRYGARVLTLPVNYRSGSRILAMAGYFQQYGDRLKGSREECGNIRVTRVYDPMAEGYYLAERIRNLREEGVPCGQIAVFYRLQMQSKVLEQIFSREDIPFEVTMRREADETNEAGYCDETLLGIQTVRPSGDKVQLMTLHASKGLEFTYVFIIGVNYGLIPLHPAGMEEEEEERRLFFVGMTRARDFLELSCYTNPGMPKVAEGPSRFLQIVERRLETLAREEVPTDMGMQERGSMAAADYAARLKGLKREILENRLHIPEAQRQERAEKAEPVPSDEEASAPTVYRRVRHGKYGEGQVLSETEDMITVTFEGYGQKEFMKAFVTLEEI